MSITSATNLGTIEALAGNTIVTFSTNIIQTSITQAVSDSVNLGTISANAGSTILTLTGGFDPIAVAALTVRLRTTGQIWPIGGLN